MPSRSVGAPPGIPPDGKEGDGSGPGVGGRAAGDVGPTRRRARVGPAVDPAPLVSFAPASTPPAEGFVADIVTTAWRVLVSASAPAGARAARTEKVGVFSGKRSTSRSRGIAGVCSAGARPARVNAGVASAGGGSFAAPAVFRPVGFRPPGGIAATSEASFVVGLGTPSPPRVRDRPKHGSGFGSGSSSARSAAERVPSRRLESVAADASRGVGSGRSRGANARARAFLPSSSLALTAADGRAALALAVSASARAAVSASVSARARAARASFSFSSRSRFARASAALSAARV